MTKMKRKFTSLTLATVLLILTACGTPKPGTPSAGGGFNAQAISSGVITSLVAVQATLQALVASGKTGFQGELDAINKVLASAQSINADIQNGAFSGDTDKKITEIAKLATTLAAQFGANSNFILAINIGVGLFQSIRNAFRPPSTPTGAASAPVDWRAKQDQLDATVDAYKAEVARRAKK